VECLGKIVQEQNQNNVWHKRKEQKQHLGYFTVTVLQLVHQMFAVVTVIVTH
jgi:predicted restriction endonuclease